MSIINLKNCKYKINLKKDLKEVMGFWASYKKIYRIIYYCDM